MLHIVLCVGTLSLATSKAEYQSTWTSLEKRPIPTWYDDAKLGIFLHWGVFAVPSFGSPSEWFWSEWDSGNHPDVNKFMQHNYPPNFTYAEFAPHFTAEFFDPNFWADLFNASGARYVVLTSKHHDGYTLWPSKYSFNWNSVDVGPNRDLVGDLAAAIRSRTSLEFGLYYSLYEWFNRLYILDKEAGFSTNYYVTAKAMPELHELVEKYKPSVVWSDGDWDAPDTYWNSTDFISWLYNDSPVKDIVVTNDRWGNGTQCKHGGYLTCKDGFNPGKLQNRKWENCLSYDVPSWGYRRTARVADFLTIEQVIHTFIQTVSCGGNLLFNIGPTPEGTITPYFETTLRQIGQWLSVNGEAIYSTKAWTHQQDSADPNVWYTTKGSDVFAFFLKWPDTGNLTLESLPPSDQMKVTMLGYGQEIEWMNFGKGVIVNLPALTPNLVPCQWAWALHFINVIK